MFRVVPDQLRISDGWVRCGQCDEIFDASIHLLQAPPDVGVPAGKLEERAANFDTIESSDVAPLPLDTKLDSDSDASVEQSPVEQAQDMSDLAPDIEERSLPQTMWPVPVSAAPLDHAAPADTDDPDPDQSAELSKVSFLRVTRPGSFWGTPILRATLGLLSLLLVLGLVGQIAFHERDRIAAAEPNLKPLLLTFCGLLNCSLSPLRRIESIVIDSSSFAEIQGGTYRLNFSLKNTAATALAVPAIELTLTDTLDQPVVRRVFMPTELGVKADTLTAGSEWAASFAMAVKSAGAADRVAGYRLLAFYP